MTYIRKAFIGQFLVIAILAFISQGAQGDNQSSVASKGAMQSTKPNSLREISWNDGISALKNGQLTKGLLLLDSFRLSGYKNDSFLELYSQEVLKTLVPQKSDSVIALFRQFTTIDTGLNFPLSHFFTVTQSKNRNNAFVAPCYTYGATFELRKPFRLVFSGLDFSNQSVMTIGFHYDPTVEESMNRQRWDRKDIASCKLFIDLNTALGSPMQYIRDKINGTYDSVSIRHDFNDKQGISLRCITRSRNNGDDSYTAIATFDRFLPDVRTRPNHHTDTILTMVRYTLIAQSCGGNADRIEARFLTVLRTLL